MQAQLARIQNLDALTKDSTAITVDNTTLRIFSRVGQGTTGDSLEEEPIVSLRLISQRTGTSLIEVLLEAKEGEVEAQDLESKINHALTVFEVVGIE